MVGEALFIEGGYNETKLRVAIDALTSASTKYNARKRLTVVKIIQNFYNREIWRRGWGVVV